MGRDRGQLIKRFLFSTALLFSSWAYANGDMREWAVTVKEDVFNGSGTAALMGGNSSPISLYLACSSYGDKFWSIIFRPGDGQFKLDVPALITFKTSDIPLFRLAGKSYLHENGLFWGFSIAVDHPQVFANFLNAVFVSKGVLDVTLSIPSTGVERTEKLSLDGAQETIAKLAAACKIDNPTEH